MHIEEEFLEKLRESAEKALPIPLSYVGMGSEIYEHLAKMCLKGKLHLAPLSRASANDQGFVKALINNCYGLSSSDDKQFMNIKSVAEWNKEYVNLYFLNMKEVYKEWQDHSFYGATLAFELHLPTKTEAEATRVRTLRQLGLWFLDDLTYNKKRYKGGDIMGLIHACMFRNEFDTSLSTFEPAPWTREIGSNTTILNDEYNKQSFNEKSQKWLKNKNKKGK